VNLEEFAATQGGKLAQVQLAWVIDDEELTISHLKKLGQSAFADLADRYEFTILTDVWTVDGPFLKVIADCIYWPTGEPARIVLVDDIPSEVPA